MKNMDDYRFQNELEYQLAFYWKVSENCYWYMKNFTRRRQKAICFRELAEVSCLIRS